LAKRAAVELPGHRFFIATLFQPQLSAPEAPHRFFLAFCEPPSDFVRDALKTKP